MYKEKSICVVVPAYNEEKLIGKVIQTVPTYVDKIVVVDDKSKDRTAEIVRGYKSAMKERLLLLQHEKNEGPGGAVATGYEWARENGMDITAVMAGDAQMEPQELRRIIDPIATGEADYTKGNRLFSGEAWRLFPKARYIGSAFLSLLTKVASGYWHTADPQCGYTAISLDALRAIQIKNLHRRYGLPNIVLVELNVCQFKVKDIHMKPIYNVGEKSSINLWSATFSLLWLLFRCFLWRMKEKYVIRDFHPLVFFYLLGLVTFPTGLFFGLHLVYYRVIHGPVAATSALFAAFLCISGLQLLLFAMWFDMEYSRRAERL